MSISSTHHTVPIGEDCSEAEVEIEGRQSLELSRIAARYYDQLVRFIRRRGADDAADVAQDAFARLSGVDLRHIKSPGPFLFATAMNLLRDRARSAESHYTMTTIDANDAELVSAVPSAERVVDAKEQLAILEAALNELNPDRRASLVLYRFDGLSHAEIAGRLGISVSMVEKHINRALAHCRKRLDDANRPSAHTGVRS